MKTLQTTAFLLLGYAAASHAWDVPLEQPHDYVAAMQKTAAQFQGRSGVVLHIGDSITYSNPYGQWARAGKGKTAADRAILQWMHMGTDDERDGWWLCRFDHPSGGRSHTACSGVRADEMLKGGRRGMLSLTAMLDRYRPQIVVLMLGTNDASARRPVDDYLADMSTCVDEMLERGVICILSTIPPHFRQPQVAQAYNNGLRELAKQRSLPLIDFEREILQRRPTDWNGTLLGRNDVHPTASRDGVSPVSQPTTGNLRSSGYLLRGWLSVQKIAEVKRTVIDGSPLVGPVDTDTLMYGVSRPVPAPQGERIRLPITRDTRMSSVGREVHLNGGRSSSLKLKSNQEMALLDFDPSELKGRVINGATLHVHITGAERLRRITASSFASPWIEGTEAGRVQNASSTFAARRHPDTPWAHPGSDLTAVMLGNGGTVWKTADAMPPDTKGWQRIAVDPSVVAARVAGISYGVLLFDDTGTELVRDGEQVTVRPFPNRYIHSREQNASAPYIVVYAGKKDVQPPEVPDGLHTSVGDLPAGELLVSWNTPVDQGAAGTVGFIVTLNGKPVPRYLIPRAATPGDQVQMHVRDLKLTAGQYVTLSVRAVDGAGNQSPAATVSAAVSDRQPESWPGFAGASAPSASTARLPRLGTAEVAVIDAMDKVHPVSGSLIPTQTDDYLGENHLWNAAGQTIRLQAARNEFVAFQVSFRGTVQQVQPEFRFETGSGMQTEFSRFRHVSTREGMLPDPVIRLDGPFNVPARDAVTQGQTHGSMLCEVYVPHHARAGRHNAVLSLRTAQDTLELKVELDVWDFTLPDRLSFLPEMNCYSLPTNEREYYRLGHLHRTILNRVPYSQRGDVNDGCAPIWDGQKLDWTRWDRRFGPYLDGSAFADLPRKGVPLECFYLPLHENWPASINRHYNGDEWADRAFTTEYRQAFVTASKQMAEHFHQQGWTATLFQMYLNNKNNYKRNGWSRGSSPWLLDEPSHFQDYWALRWFGQAFHDGVSRAGGDARLLFRADISRSQWQRDLLDNVLDYNVVGGGMRKYQRIVMDRVRQTGHIAVEYGGTNAIDASNMQPVGWCLDAWAWGYDGVIPWQTVGRADSWNNADALSLFYPGSRMNQAEPVPSIRLKAYRRGQQDVEYLTLLAQALDEPRWAIGQQVRNRLKLSGQRRGTGFVGDEDAGLMHYAALKPQDVWKLRHEVGRILNGLKPEPRVQLVDFRTPRRRPSTVSGYVSVGETPAASSTASVPSVTANEPLPASTMVKVLQGRAAVRDAVIDPAQPDRPLGRAPRDNRIRRADKATPMLLYFDLGRLALPQDAQLVKAEVSIFVWDPSSKGRTKLGVFPLKYNWDESSVTWNSMASGKPWSGGAGFALSRHAGAAVSHVVVNSDAERDIVNPPVEYRVDITSAARAWLRGEANYGVVISPIIDRAVDDGLYSRFQVYASEYSTQRYAPKLTIRYARD